MMPIGKSKAEGSARMRPPMRKERKRNDKNKKENDKKTRRKEKRQKKKKGKGELKKTAPAGFLARQRGCKKMVFTRIHTQRVFQQAPAPQTKT